MKGNRVIPNANVRKCIKTWLEPPAKMIPTECKKLFEQLVSNDEIGFIRKVYDDAGHQIRIAGGAVRDLLSGKLPHDIDFATTATPDQSKKILNEHKNVRLILTKAGERHGTVTARINEKSVYEITTLRCDVLTDGRHAKVEFITDWKLDAERRDLTFNAMFLTLDGHLIDYYNGESDLKNGIVRFVGDPAKRIQEDYLRILRYFRFWSRYGRGRPDDPTLNVLKEHLDQPGLDRISGERIWSELKRIFEHMPCDNVVDLMLELQVFIRLGVFGDDAGPPKQVDEKRYAKYCEEVLQDLKFVQKNLQDQASSTLAEFSPIVPFSTLIRTENQLQNALSRMKWSNYERDFVLYVLSNRGQVNTDINYYKLQLALEPKSKRSILLSRIVEFMKYTGQIEHIAELKSWPIPDFPINGGQIGHLIPPPKSNINTILNELKGDWARSEFKMTESDLMDSLQRRITHLTEPICTRLVNHARLEVECLDNFEEVFVIGDSRGFNLQLKEFLNLVHSTSVMNDPKKIVAGDLVNKRPYSLEVLNLMMSFNDTVKAVIDNQSNIYGITSLDLDEGNSKILVATHDCQMFCVDYNKFRAQAKEIEFTYIPSGAKIVSIDAFKRLNRRNDLVIGITHSLTSANQLPNAMDAGLSTDKNQTYYLNIYASGTPSREFDLDYIAQGCQTIPINYVPYHLYHTDLVTPKSEDSTMNLDIDTVWLLSGGDRCIHSFQEDRSNQCFVEKPLAENFPEFNNLPSIALWIDSKSFYRDHSFQRLTVVSLESGTVILSLTRYDLKNLKYELVQTWMYDQYTTIVPSVRLFATRSKIRKPKDTSSDCKSTDVLLKTLDSNVPLNLLLVSSTETSLVFQDVIENGFECVKELPGSQRIDCSTTSCIVDIDFDGFNELMIGTYGQELLIYKFDERKEQYFLARKHLFNYPIYAIISLDITGDVMMDLIILVTNGIHVLQANVDEAIKICEHRMKEMLASYH